MRTKDSQQSLIAGLIGSSTESHELYHNNAHFYHTINALAELLPLWVDGIAAQAKELDERLTAQVDVAKLRPVDPDVARLLTLRNTLVDYDKGEVTDDSR